MQSIYTVPPKTRMQTLERNFFNLSVDSEFAADCAPTCQLADYGHRGKRKVGCMCYVCAVEVAMYIRIIAHPGNT